MLCQLPNELIQEIITFACPKCVKCENYVKEIDDCFFHIGLCNDRPSNQDEFLLDDDTLVQEIYEPYVVTSDKRINCTRWERVFNFDDINFDVVKIFFWVDEVDYCENCMCDLLKGLREEAFRCWIMVEHLIGITVSDVDCSVDYTVTERNDENIKSYIQKELAQLTKFYTNVQFNKCNITNNIS